MSAQKVSGWWGVLAIAVVVLFWDITAKVTGRMQTISHALHTFHDSGATGRTIVEDACDVLKVHLTQ